LAVVQALEVNLLNLYFIKKSSLYKLNFVLLGGGGGGFGGGEKRGGFGGGERGRGGGRGGGGSGGRKNLFTIEIKIFLKYLNILKIIQGDRTCYKCNESGHMAKGLT
jgi:hypothetical protein